MKHPLTLIPLLGLVALSLCSGCTPEHYRWQTVVNEDGTIDLAISRPIAEMPENGDSSETWQTKRFHNDMDRNIWPERITARRIESANSEHAEGLEYFIAKGHFQSLDEVPQHYRFQLEGSDLVSELRHELIINDFGLVKEYLWVEEITDIVKYEEVPIARRESIELIAAIVEEGLQEGLGDEYDVTALIQWIRNDGEKLLEEFTMLLLDPSFKQLDDESRDARFDSFLEKYGIAEASNEALEDFVRGRLTEGIKRKDEKPVKEAIIEMILDGSATGEPTAVQTAFDDAIKKRLGDKEEASEKMAALFARQVGVHGVPMQKGPHEFDAWLKLPGQVVETNGVVDEEGFLKWTFDAEDIWPRGYQMTARSVLPVRVRNNELLRKEKLGQRAEMLLFLKLVKADDEIGRAHV